MGKNEKKKKGIKVGNIYCKKIKNFGKTLVLFYFARYGMNRYTYVTFFFLRYSFWLERKTRGNLTFFEDYHFEVIRRISFAKRVSCKFCLRYRARVGKRKLRLHFYFAFFRM